MTRMNIGLVQYDPKFQDLQGNMQRVDKMIGHLTPELVDILLLPEMTFTGYMFASREEIDPFLEDENGPSISWARRTARRLEAVVLVGFPEIEGSTKRAFNSIAVVDYEGNLKVSLSSLASAKPDPAKRTLLPDDIQKTFLVRYRQELGYRRSCLPDL